MAILELDTDLLRQSVATAKQTNDAISEACTLLNQVVVHQDWKCQERTKINENTVANRQMAQQIQSHTASFYQAISQASNRFDEVEQNTISYVNQVESLLAQIMTVVQGIGGGVSQPAISAFDTIRESLED